MEEKRVILSGMWVALMLTYLLGDVLRIFAGDFEAGEVAGMLLTFAMPAADPHAGVAAPPFDGSDVFAPYKYLEAPETWYICGVALYPGYRGRGIGSQLLEIARQQAREHGYRQLSLVAFEQNRGAVRFYRRLGYREISRAPIVPHPLIHYSGDALLMVAPAA